MISNDALDAIKKIEQSKDRIAKLEEELEFHLTFNPVDLNEYVVESQKIIDKHEEKRYEARR